MNYKEFAQKYLEDAGAFDKESNYGGMLGPAIMKLVQAFSGEGHSGGSAFITNEAFYDSTTLTRVRVNTKPSDIKFGQNIGQVRKVRNYSQMLVHQV